MNKLKEKIGGIGSSDRQWVSILAEKVFKIAGSKWIIDSDGDTGFTFFGLNIVNYKWPDTFVVYTNRGLKKANLVFREIKKGELRREFEEQE
jgi:hypothetical protein